jgi:hypothetical protein
MGTIIDYRPLLAGWSNNYASREKTGSPQLAEHCLLLLASIFFIDLNDESNSCLEFGSAP